MDTGVHSEHLKSCLSLGTRSGRKRLKRCLQRPMPWTPPSHMRPGRGSGTASLKPVVPPAPFPYNTVRKCFLTTRVSMAKTRITTKGQVTIPKEVRDRLGLRPGDELEFMEEDGVFRLRKRLLPAPLKKYRGYLKDLADRNPDELVQEMRGQ